ncbi:hypothetical protein MMC06_004741 [Schaereria dolodes]|nr:hypothetical protein [Schaereria dolodes]
MNPVALGQTIAVVDRSGKVVSTSKHLINVFKEAKSAYRERKAEIVAGRHYSQEEKLGRRGPRAHTIVDERSSTSTRRHRGTVNIEEGVKRPISDRRRSSGSVRSGGSTVYPASNHRYEQELHSPNSPTSLRQEIVRRHTTREDQADGISLPPSPTRSNSTPEFIDMSLAYGEIPPPLEVAKIGEEVELKGLVGKVRLLLEEADCLQYSVTAIIASLQKNPEAMAAVALTLAEISNIVTKMAPGVLTAMKGSAPAVFALLASPQFMIAAGVGVGVTIVALGGFKIIKRIKAKQAAEDPGMDEMLEIGGDVSRIESWRRGIAEVEEESLGTIVDGEFITPQAAAMSRLSLHEGKVRENPREKKGMKSAKGSKTSKAPKSSKSSKNSKTGKPEKEKKEKKPSPLRLMFK